MTIRLRAILRRVAMPNSRLFQDFCECTPGLLIPLRPFRPWRLVAGAAGTTLLMASKNGADREMLFCAADDAGVCPIQHAYERKMAPEFGSRVTRFVHRCAVAFVSC